MNMIQIAAAAFFAGAVALTGALPAEAATARVTGTTQVRSGPGTSYRSVGQVRRGDRVNVTRCSSSDNHTEHMTHHLCCRVHYQPPRLARTSKGANG